MSLFDAVREEQAGNRSAGGQPIQQLSPQQLQRWNAELARTKASPGEGPFTLLQNLGNILKEAGIQPKIGNQGFSKGNLLARVDPTTGKVRYVRGQSSLDTLADVALASTAVVGGSLGAGSVLGGAAGGGVAGGAAVAPTTTAGGLGAGTGGSGVSLLTGGGAGTTAAGAGTAGTVAAAGGSASILDRLKRWAGAAGDVGSVLAGAGEGAADERDRENRYAGDQDRARVGLYGVQQGAALDAKGGRSREQLGFADTDLKRREFALNAPSTRARQAVLGSGLANTQDATLSGVPDRIKVPTIAGGARPSNLDANTRALGSRLTADALAGQLKGDQFDPLTPTDFEGSLIPPPELNPHQTAGGLESGLSGGGTAASIFAAIMSQLRNQSTQRSPLVR